MLMHVTIVSHNIIPGDGQGRANYEIVKHALKSHARVTLMADCVAPDLVDRISLALAEEHARDEGIAS